MKSTLILFVVVLFCFSQAFPENERMRSVVMKDEIISVESPPPAPEDGDSSRPPAKDEEDGDKKSEGGLVALIVVLSVIGVPILLIVSIICLLCFISIVCGIVLACCGVMCKMTERVIYCHRKSSIIHVDSSEDDQKEEKQQETSDDKGKELRNQDEFEINTPGEENCSNVISTQVSDFMEKSDVDISEVEVAANNEEDSEDGDNVRYNKSLSPPLQEFSDDDMDVPKISKAEYLPVLVHNPVYYQKKDVYEKVDLEK